MSDGWSRGWGAGLLLTVPLAEPTRGRETNLSRLNKSGVKDGPVGETWLMPRPFTDHTLPAGVGPEVAPPQSRRAADATGPVGS